jgi:hypothetical protein
MGARIETNAGGRPPLKIKRCRHLSLRRATMIVNDAR